MKRVAFFSHLNLENEFKIINGSSLGARFDLECVDLDLAKVDVSRRESS